MELAIRPVEAGVTASAGTVGMIVTCPAGSDGTQSPPPLGRSCQPAGPAWRGSYAEGTDRARKGASNQYARWPEGPIAPPWRAELPGDQAAYHGDRLHNPKIINARKPMICGAGDPNTGLRTGCTIPSPA